MALEYIEVEDANDVVQKVAVRDLGSDIKAQVLVPYQENRQDTFTGVASGTTVNVSEAPCSRFAMQVKGTGAAPTAWEVVLEGSLNNSQFTTLLTHTNTTNADGAVAMTATAAPIKYFRSRCVSLTLGSATNIVVEVIGEAA